MNCSINFSREGDEADWPVVSCVILLSFVQAWTDGHFSDSWASLLCDLSKLKNRLAITLAPSFSICGCIPFEPVDLWVSSLSSYLQTSCLTSRNWDSWQWILAVETETKKTFNNFTSVSCHQDTCLIQQQGHTFSSFPFPVGE